MKRWVFISCTTVIVLFLVACAKEQMKADENSMAIHITSKANFDFQMLEVFVGKQGGGVTNADGSKIVKGETLSFVYEDQEDFPLEGQGTFEFVLVDEENRVPLKTLTIALAKKKEYHYQIIGDTMEDADLKLVE